MVWQPNWPATIPRYPYGSRPNGVDVERFGPDAGTRDRVRKELDVAPDVLVALFVGGDWERKGLAIAIKGIAEARDRRAELELWVIGQGQEPRFRDLARRAGVADRVRFFGARADVARFYQAADIFILPTAYETFSLVAHEAAACGLPVVATRVSGIEDLVGDDEAGILVARTPEAMGDALARLAADDSAPAVDGRLKVGAVPPD